MAVIISVADRAERARGRHGRGRAATVFPTVVHMLADAAARAPDAERWCSRIAGSAIANICLRRWLARELESLGARGGRVALILGNALESAVATFAVLPPARSSCPQPIYTARESANPETPAPTVVLHDAANGHRSHAARRARHQARQSARAGPGGCSMSGATRTSRCRALPAPDDLATLAKIPAAPRAAQGVDLTHRAIAINVAQREALAADRAGPRAAALRHAAVPCLCGVDGAAPHRLAAARS